MGSKVKVTETFAGGGITIDGSPSKTILFPIRHFSAARVVGLTLAYKHRRCF